MEQLREALAGAGVEVTVEGQYAYLERSEPDSWGPHGLVRAPMSCRQRAAVPASTLEKAAASAGHRIDDLLNLLDWQPV